MAKFSDLEKYKDQLFTSPEYVEVWPLECQLKYFLKLKNIPIKESRKDEKMGSKLRRKLMLQARRTLKNSKEPGIVYSFELDPLKHQPSGTVNFSLI